MIRLAAERDLPSITGIYDAIPDREEAGPAYTNWQRGKNPTKKHRPAGSGGPHAVCGGRGRSPGRGEPKRDPAAGIRRHPPVPPRPGGPGGRDPHPVYPPSCAGRGYARQMAVFCEEEARRQGKTVMRPDTWEHNTPANRMYPALGYRLAGAAEFFFMGFVHEVLNCYEKVL